MMTDDLTQALAQALDRRHHLNTADLAAHLAAALAPLIEARVRERLAHLEGRFPCDRGCSDAPEEECSRHGRTPSELWAIVAEVASERAALLTALDEAREWLAEAEDAEARIEAVRALHPAIPDLECDCCPETCRECGCEWPCPTIEALEGSTASTSPPRSDEPTESASEEVPTPIDPTDIRPGDVVERRRRYVVQGRGPDFGIDARCEDTNTHEVLNPAVGTWHLVSRPDPDAEAIEALATRIYANPANKYDIENAADVLQALRDGGWDIVRRAES